jgi:hypothetical protein
MNYRRLSSQAVLGAALVLVGVVLLLQTTNLYDVGPLLRYVPSLFVLVGAYALVASGFRNLVGPVLVIVVASAWQAVTLGLVDGPTLLDFWPVLLILFGLSLALGRVRPRPAGTESDRVSGFALFGGVERRALSKRFREADLTALFGGTTLDLRDVEREPGEDPVRVSAMAMFGAVEVIAPREWNVQLDVLPIFGAAEDSRLRAERDRERESDAVDLVVDGFVAFGGVEVKD